MSKNGKELKNINQDTNTSINSYNPKITYYETQPSNNSNLFKTSSNFHPYSHNNNFNSTLQSFDNKNKLKDYIIYLKSNLNSSYYANNDLNNEYNKLLNKLYKLNERIKNYNKEYDEMIISYEKNLEKNNKLKKDYNILIEEYKLYNSNTEQKIKDLYDIKNKLENDINIKTNENNNLIKDIKNKTEKI
jgi:chromosome segregation ATPase